MFNKGKIKGWHIKEANSGFFYMINYSGKDSAWYPDKAICWDEDTKSYYISGYDMPYGFSTAEHAIEVFYAMKKDATIAQYNYKTKNGLVKLDVE